MTSTWSTGVGIKKRLPRSCDPCPPPPRIILRGDTLSLSLREGGCAGCRWPWAPVWKHKVIYSPNRSPRPPEHSANPPLQKTQRTPQTHPYRGNRSSLLHCRHRGEKTGHFFGNVSVSLPPRPRRGCRSGVSGGALRAGGWGVVSSPAAPRSLRCAHVNFAFPACNSIQTRPFGSRRHPRQEGSPGPQSSPLGVAARARRRFCCVSLWAGSGFRSRAARPWAHGGVASASRTWAHGGVASASRT